MNTIKNLLRAISAGKLNPSLKINQKICVAMATLIAVSGVTVSVASQQKSNTALAESASVKSTTYLSAAPTTVNSQSNNINIAYNMNSYCKVFVKKYGNAAKYLVAKTTVKDALKTVKVKLGKKDVMNCKYSDPVKENMSIVINKVEYKTKNVTQTLTYKKFKKAYPNVSTKKLDKDSKVKVNKTVSVKYVNGKKNKTTTKSISYKSLVVTKKYSSINAVSELKPKADFKLTKSGIPVKYSKKITGTASAYSCGTTTATGKSVKPGYIAVNPNQIPYGTKMFIRTTDGSYVYGYASAEDTGGFVAWENTLCDLFFNSESACISFGRRTVEIYILD